MDFENIPDNWRLIDLADVCKIIMGNSPPGESYNKIGDGIRFLQGQNEFGDRTPTSQRFTTDPSRLSEEGDVLVAIRATPLGIVNQADEEYCVGRGVASLRVGEELDSDYLYHYMTYCKESNYWERVSTGSTYPSVTKTNLQNLSIPLPPLSIQKRIADKLNAVISSLDQALESQNSAEELETSLMDSILKSIIYDGLSEFDEVLVENVCKDIKNGGTPKRSEESYWDGDIPWLKSGELNNSIIHQSEEYMTQKGLYESSAKMFPSNTVLVAMYGATRGKTGYIMNEMSANQAVCGLTPDTEQCLSKYLWYCMRGLQSQLASQGRGGGQDNINQSTIRETSIPLPPLDRQKKIIERIETVEERINMIREATTEMTDILNRLPESLYHKAFSGNLTDYNSQRQLNIEGQASISEF